MQIKCSNCAPHDVDEPLILQRSFQGKKNIEQLHNRYTSIYISYPNTVVTVLRMNVTFSMG